MMLACLLRVAAMLGHENIGEQRAVLPQTLLIHMLCIVEVFGDGAASIFGLNSHAMYC
jgi:hypothetical protein